MAESTHADQLARRLLAGATPEEVRALLDVLLTGRAASILETLRSEEPALRPAPAEVRGFRVRLGLRGARPPVWRRLELPGDLTLPQLHRVIQNAMGWTDSHLHRFRTGRDLRSPHFVTSFDLDDGDDGALEDDVRLDQLVAAKGDALWYEYDFGDGWHHDIRVEEVLKTPPPRAHCTGGRMACPPEDCGGIGGYAELAAWVRSGYDDALLPEVFDDADHAHDWLPIDWHPDEFDLDEVNDALSIAEPLAVPGELADLLEACTRSGAGELHKLLRGLSSQCPVEVTDAEATRLTEVYRLLLEAVGNGIALTSAGYLPPYVVEQLAEGAGITGWWIGKANREDLTPPVARARETARALGLVTVRKGQLLPTTAGIRCRHDSQALWRHIVGRLPLGRKEYDRHAGWLALAVVGSGTPAEEWTAKVGELLFALGWRSRDDSSYRRPGRSLTLEVLEQLGGAARTGHLMGTDGPVAATAQAVCSLR